jgi:Zn finger protein HypA/HybF involved in hydrogenase expression
MHELSLVEELVSECSGLAQGRTVVEVQARCPASIDADELSEGFAFLAEQADRLGGAECLSHARLNVESIPVYFECSCGFAGELGADSFAGHIGICPRCNQVSELVGAVELVAIKYAGTPIPLAPEDGPPSLGPIPGPRERPRAPGGSL